MIYLKNQDVGVTVEDGDPGMIMTETSRGVFDYTEAEADAVLLGLLRRKLTKEGADLICAKVDAIWTVMQMLEPRR
jgi:hypothetical protein